MSTNRQGDADMDRLLRAVLKPESRANADGCPDAGLLAALVEGGVSPQEQAALDEHIVRCGRCQEALAVMTRDVPPVEAAAPQAGWFTWVIRPRLRWLVPITAVATVAALFVATRSLVAPGDSTTPAEVAQFAQAAPPPPSAATEGAIERDKSAASSAKPPAEPALKEEIARRQASRASSAKQVADAASVPSPARQAAVESKGAAEAAADLAGRAATDEKRTRAAAEPAAAPMAAAPGGTGVSSRAGAATSTVSVVGAARDAPPAALGRDALRNEFRSVETASRTVEAPGGAVRWRFASGGQIWRSVDAGLTWHEQASGVPANLVAGSAPSATICWAVGAAGTVLLTQDGERWERRSFPLSVDLTAIEARTARIAAVTTRDGRRYETLDGGFTWSPR